MENSEEKPKKTKKVYKKVPKTPKQLEKIAKVKAKYADKPKVVAKKGNTSKRGGQFLNKNAEKWTEKEALQLGQEMLNWFMADMQNIFFDEFLFCVVDEKKYRGAIGADTPNFLCKKFQSFADILTKCRRIEETRLKSLSVKGLTNATMSKFILSAQYGMTETTKQVVENNVKVLNIDPL